jgi:hypothetical protein
MFDQKWGNQWLKIVVCSLVLIACENPGPVQEEAVERAGAAGSAAVKAATRADNPWEENGATSDDLQNELADASVRRSGARAAPPCGHAGSADGACEGRLAGVYGIEVKVDVAWSDEINPTAPVFDSARGQVVALLIAELSGLCSGEAEGDLVTRMCDLRLPALHANATGKDVQLMVPHATWDRASIPEFTARVRSSNGAEPGFEIASPMIAMLGIELESLDAAWPSHRETALVACGGGRSGAGCFPDQDEDGQPGITLLAAASGTPVPTDVSLPFAGIGAATLFAGLRTKLGGSYPAGPDCNGATGDATAGDLELRVLDCTMQDGAPCTPGAATIADRNMPVFHARHATNRVIRLSDSRGALSCEDVRWVFARGD